MSQQYKSLFNANSNKYSHSYLQSIFSSSYIITISIGVYFVKNYKSYKDLKDLPYMFTKGIDKIVSTNPKAFCIHNGNNSVIYIFNDCKLENQNTLNELYVWLTRLQTTLRTIRFSNGMDIRKMQGTQSILTSELMAYYRMFKNIHENTSNQLVLMEKRHNIISIIKNILCKAIEYNHFVLYSEDIMEISQYLDKLINRHIYKKTMSYIESNT